MLSSSLFILFSFISESPAQQHPKSCTINKTKRFSQMNSHPSCFLLIGLHYVLTLARALEFLFSEATSLHADRQILITCPLSTISSSYLFPSLPHSSLPSFISQQYYKMHRRDPVQGYKTPQPPSTRNKRSPRQRTGLLLAIVIVNSTPPGTSVLGKNVLFFYSRRCVFTMVPAGNSFFKKRPAGF